MNDEEIGDTPVSTPFTHYGPRKLMIVRDGYETETVVQPINPPWYQIFPFDFFSENLYPGEISDERTVDVHIGRLRKSLVHGQERDVIRTVRGAGYIFGDR